MLKNQLYEDGLEEIVKGTFLKCSWHSRVLSLYRTRAGNLIQLAELWDTI